LQRLVTEFRTELTTLGARVDKLESRTAFLESRQFSTTTKLTGEVITYLGDAFGENAGSINNSTLGYRVRLDFNTSFTGKDRLRTRLQATNLRLFDTAATFGGNLGAGTTGQTGETRFTPSSVSQNGDIRLTQLEYQFPIGDRIKLYLEAGTIDPSYITDTITPFVDTATAALSNFGQVNPIYFPIGNRAGLGGNFKISQVLNLDFGYFGEDFSGRGSPSNPGLSSGIFKGGYSAFAQLVLNTGSLKVGLLYLNSYSVENGVDTLAGSNAAKVIGAGPVVGNNDGIQANYRFSPSFELGGWVGYTAARALGNGTRGDASIWNYAVTLAFPDLGKKGNLGGIVVGMQPKLTSTSNEVFASAIGLPINNEVQQRSDRNTGFHIEAFYRYQLTKNISITPGVFWLTAPNHDDRNLGVVIGALRTTLTF
jgi:Carbohydrate-selective porin, OprB family